MQPKALDELFNRFREGYRQRTHEALFKHKRASRPSAFPNQILQLAPQYDQLLQQLQSIEVENEEQALIFLQNYNTPLRDIIFTNDSARLKALLQAHPALLKEIVYFQQQLSATLDPPHLLQAFPAHFQQFLIQFFAIAFEQFKATPHSELIYIVDYTISTIYNVKFVLNDSFNQPTSNLQTLLIEFLSTCCEKFDLDCICSALTLLKKLALEYDAAHFTLGMKFILQERTLPVLSNICITFIINAIKCTLRKKNQHQLLQYVDKISQSKLHDYLIHQIVVSQDLHLVSNLFQYFQALTNLENVYITQLVTNQQVYQLINIKTVRKEQKYFFLSAIVPKNKFILECLLENTLLHELIFDLQNAELPVQNEAFYLLCVLVKISPNLKGTNIPDLLNIKFRDITNSEHIIIFLEAYLCNPEAFRYSRDQSLISRIQSLANSENSQISDKAINLLDFV